MGVGEVSMCEGQDDNSDNNKERQGICVQSLMAGTPGFRIFFQDGERKMADHMASIIYNSGIVLFFLP